MESSKKKFLPLVAHCVAAAAHCAVLLTSHTNLYSTDKLYISAEIKLKIIVHTNFVIFITNSTPLPITLF
jgi:hypothetical protein